MWCNSRGRDPERLVGKQCVLGTTGVESLACAHPGPPRGGELAWSAPTQVTRSWEEARMQTHAPSGRTDSDGRARTARRPHQQRAQTAVRWLTGHPACCPTHPECKSWGTPSLRRDQRKAGVGSCRGRGSRRTCPIAGRESGSTFLSLPACVLEPGWGADQAPEGPRARLLPCKVDMGPEALCAPRPSRHKPLQHLGHPRLGSRSGRHQSWAQHTALGSSPPSQEHAVRGQV